MLYFQSNPSVKTSVEHSVNIESFRKVLCSWLNELTISGLFIFLYILFKTEQKTYQMMHTSYVAGHPTHKTWCFS